MAQRAPAVLTDTGVENATSRVLQVLSAHEPMWRVTMCTCGTRFETEGDLEAHVASKVAEAARADVPDLLAVTAAQAWTVGHHTAALPDPDANCMCDAWNVGECACGRYGLTIDAPNPYEPTLVGSDTTG